MDIEKLLKWGTEYLSNYFSVFVATLRTPTARFQPVVTQDEQSRLVSPGSIPSSYTGPNLNPRLFGFLIISIFIGTTLNSLVPKRPTSPDLVTTSVVTIAVWFAYSTTVYLICKILKGKGGFWETISVALQLLAVVYVIGNFTAFFWGLLAQTSMFRAPGSDYFGLLIEHPIFLYYIVQFILMLIYLPIALKNVHGFGWRRQIVATLIPISWALFATTVFIGTRDELGVVMPNKAGRIAAETEILRRLLELESQQTTQPTRNEPYFWAWIVIAVVLLVMIAAFILVLKWRSRK